uniref:Activin_recp domain-containing protein n=1 Tax=Parastrongyloides trichosuri TaxID=131310 RepID=A0A0N4ZR63_PARTI
MKVHCIILSILLLFTAINSKEIACRRFCKYISGNSEIVGLNCMEENYGDGLCKSTIEEGCSIAKMNIDGSIVLAGGCPTSDFIKDIDIKKNDCGTFETYLEEDNTHLTSHICRCHETFCNTEEML